MTGDKLCVSTCTIPFASRPINRIGRGQTLHSLGDDEYSHSSKLLMSSRPCLAILWSDQQLSMHSVWSTRCTCINLVQCSYEWTSCCWYDTRNVILCSSRFGGRCFLSIWCWCYTLMVIMHYQVKGHYCNRTPLPALHSLLNLAGFVNLSCLWLYMYKKQVVLVVWCGPRGENTKNKTKFLAASGFRVWQKSNLLCDEVQFHVFKLWLCMTFSHTHLTL